MRARLAFLLAAAWTICAAGTAAGAAEPAAPAVAGCSGEGAFGIRFGDRPPAFLKPAERSGLNRQYAYKPPRPSPHFDQYRIVADASGTRIYQVLAFHRLEALHERMTRAAKEESRQRAAQVLRDYAASQGQDLDADYPRAEADVAVWTRRMGEVTAELHGDSPWTAWISCTHVPLADEARRSAAPAQAPASGPSQHETTGTAPAPAS